MRCVLQNTGGVLKCIEMQPFAEESTGHDVNINEHHRSRSGDVWSPRVIAHNGHMRSVYPEGLNASPRTQSGAATLIGMDLCRSAAVGCQT